MSAFGEWGDKGGLPVFHERVHPENEICRWDPQVAPETNRHWSGFGNRRWQVIADNYGSTAIWDTSRGLDWLTASEPGTGASAIRSERGDEWATDLARWPGTWAERPPTRTWGPTWYEILGRHEGLTIERMVAAPEGDLACVLVRVTVAAERDMTIELAEEWLIAPRSIGLKRLGLAPHGDLAEHAYTTRFDDRGIEVLAAESWRAPTRFLRLSTPAAGFRGESDGAPTPTIRLVAPLTLTAGEPHACWFVLSRDDVTDDPAALWDASLELLRKRLPRAQSPRAPEIQREIPWHIALLTGGACTDAVLGGHTLDQASAYSFQLGFNGAARDPLQHALPLVYCEPDLALSVLRNTCTWGNPQGELPWGIHGDKQPLTDLYQPSDQSLWSMWLAAEYAAATGDLAAFAKPVGFHPRYGADPVPLVEHLVRHYRYLVDVIGVGSHGHIRICNADWNDSALVLSPVERSVMQEEGESVLNSAMAAWVLPRFAGLLRRVASTAEAGGDDLVEIAADADERAERWRQLVANDWNGRWFRRAHGPGAVVGDDECWLEVQPWAILSGAATTNQATALLATIDTILRSDSPLGARLRGPVPIRVPDERIAGEGTSGGIWYSINMTLAWAARDHDPDLAWDELRRMTLASHTAAYPLVWEGTIAGPDAYNTPESPRPGRTWAWKSRGVAMQSFPVTNLHAHAQVVLTYLRLLGVEPTPEGALAVGDGDAGSFSSRTFEFTGDGTGRLESLGSVRVETRNHSAEGSGSISW